MIINKNQFFAFLKVVCFATYLQTKLFCYNTFAVAHESIKFDLSRERIEPLRATSL